MSIWNILGISETLDVALIKRAYAERLKQCKPDEKPAEFQQLHQAYKQAVQRANMRAGAARRSARSGLDDVEQMAAVVSLPSNSDSDAASARNAIYSDDRDDGIETATKSPAYVSCEAEAASNENAQSIDGAALDFDLLIHCIDTLLKNAAKRDEVDAWRFLLESPYIVNLSFTRRIGLHTLKQIHHNFHGASRDARTTATLSDDVIAFLCSLFGWHEDRDELVRRCGLNVVDEVLAAGASRQPDDDALAHVRGGKAFKRARFEDTLPFNAIWYMGSPLKRLLAFLIDFVPLAVLGFKASEIYLRGPVPLGYHRWIMALMFFLYVVASAVCEASRWQSTPGKWIFGLKVFNRNRERLNVRQSIERGLSFVVSNVGVMIVWILNFMFSQGNMVHDRMSKTHVYDMRYSLKKYRQSLHPKPQNSWLRFEWGILAACVLVLFVMLVNTYSKRSNTAVSPPNASYAGARATVTRKPTTALGTWPPASVIKRETGQTRSPDEQWLEIQQPFPADAAQKSRDEEYRKTLHDLESASGQGNYDVFDKDVDTIVEGKR